MINPKSDELSDRDSAVGAITSRYYESQNDLVQMEEMLMRARLLTNDWRYPHIGELAWNFFMVLCHLDPCQHIRLWHAHGELVGFAMLGEDPSFDCQILPAYAWLGIEEQALAWAEALLAGLRIQDPQRWGGDLVAGARQDDAPRLAFLERHGFRCRGDFSEVNLLRSLDEHLPALIVPEGCQVRELAAAGELSQRASLQRQVWQPWSVGEVSDQDYARFMQLPGYDRQLDIVTVASDGVIAAYVNGWIDPLNRIGDFGPVGALEDYRRQGLTRATLQEGLRRMQALGMQRVCISTTETNTPARRLYESLGFKIENRYLDYVKE